MGGLFSSLGKKSLPDIYLDLENAEPQSEQESQIFNEFRSVVLDPSVSIFERFSQYKDGQDLAAIALANPSPEAKEAAWNAIYPNVQLQMEVYRFAKSLSEQFIKIIGTIIKRIEQSHSSDFFSEMPAVTKSFIDCFDIILTFDEIKLTLPKLLNDLAFFRRNLPSHNDDGSLDELLDASNSSTIFWAAPTPMLNEAISSIQATYPQNSPDFEKLLFLFGSVSDVATSILKRHQFDNEKPNKLCLRCIVGAVLIFDHLSPTGCFTSRPLFHVRDAMEVLVNFQPQQKSLINAMKFSSKHLGDTNADPKIKQLFA